MPPPRPSTLLVRTTQVRRQTWRMFLFWTDSSLELSSSSPASTTKLGLPASSSSSMALSYRAGPGGAARPPRPQREEDPPRDEPPRAEPLPTATSKPPLRLRLRPPRELPHVSGDLDQPPDPEAPELVAPVTPEKEETAALLPQPEEVPPEDIPHVQGEAKRCCRKTARVERKAGRRRMKNRRL